MGGGDVSRPKGRTFTADAASVIKKRSEAADRMAPGQKVRAAFTPAGFHLFDPTIEQAIAIP